MPVNERACSMSGETLCKTKKSLRKRVGLKSFVFFLLQIKMEMFPKLFPESRQKDDQQNEDAVNVV